MYKHAVKFNYSEYVYVHTRVRGFQLPTYQNRLYANV